ncbi:MAG TPA: TerC/Alx family metal homeostasis membrane protein [Candidatus Polarisedimenticolaceae bacterium]|nr:TerC/Alx family metal homeostasis membrane protein [Candidatus Polarisedimenticolaceae bacterium]
MTELLGGHSAMPWILFNVFLAVCLAIDFTFAAGKHRAIGFKEAIGWNVFWIVIALAFTGVVIYEYGRAAGAAYLTGYVVERALSIDNLFVFLIIFQYFHVKDDRQARVLFWGIIGALLMRGVFILLGAALVAKFHFLLYFFGAFLLYTGVALIVKKDEKSPHPEKNLVVRLASKIIPMDAHADEDQFFVKRSGKWHGTPLFVVLLLVATTDFVFALDSLPAILGITRDPWILYTSNAFAILGMRVLYFLLAALLPKFRFLNYGLSIILVFIGLRMLLEKWVHLGTELTLGIVVLVLAGSMVASMVIPERKS